MELETLAVVWAVSHFHAYLYGHNVHVLTDHSAVRAVLETPNLTGKHTRWWSKVFGSGIKNITIKYRSGKENSNSDALSRCPQGQAPSTPMVTDAEVHSVDTDDIMSQLLQCPPVSSPLPCSRPENQSYRETACGGTCATLWRTRGTPLGSRH